VISNTQTEHIKVTQTQAAYCKQILYCKVNTQSIGENSAVSSIEKEKKIKQHVSKSGDLRLKSSYII
jgi:hypothetical protein